jgi:hypothetical protein
MALLLWARYLLLSAIAAVAAGCLWTGSAGRGE